MIPKKIGVMQFCGTEILKHCSTEVLQSNKLIALLKSFISPRSLRYSVEFSKGPHYQLLDFNGIPQRPRGSSHARKVLLFIIKK